MTTIALLDDLLSDVVRPIGNALLDVLTHPVDTVSNIAISAANTAKAHPYACTAIVGLGAYAFHKGWLKIDKNRLHVNINIDTPIGGYKTNTTFRIGHR